jgi:broad specificity phosphatase PhoE
MELVIPLKPALKQIILIRHAATDMAGVLCGHSDPPLNHAGQEQVASLAHHLRDTPVGRIYTSDLRRAVQTAEAISASRRIPLLCRRELREISFGAWEGLRWPEVQARSPELSGTGYESLHGQGAPNGETMRDFRTRVLSALDEIASEAGAHDRIAVVTHLGVIRTALTELANVDSHSELLRQIGCCSAHSIRIERRTWVLAERFH